jgi:hypothetical protein
VVGGAGARHGGGEAVKVAAALLGAGGGIQGTGGPERAEKAPGRTGMLGQKAFLGSNEKKRKRVVE